jgi:hypothetical protein
MVHLGTFYMLQCSKHHTEVDYCAIVENKQQVRFGKHIFIVVLEGSSTAEQIVQDIRGFFDKIFNALWQLLMGL